MKFGPYITILLTHIQLWVCATIQSLDIRRTAVVLSTLFFTSFVNPCYSQCVVICKNSLNVSLGVNGESIMTPGILLVDTQCDPADFSVAISDGQGNNYGNTLTCANIGQTLTAMVTQIATGNSCATTLYVYDYLPPFISCQDTTILCVDSFDPNDLGYPSVTDNCSSMDSTQLSYSDQINELACFTQHNSDSITTHIERTWTAEDDFGNVSTCVQNIYLRRATIADVDFPADRNGFDDPVVDCTQDPFDLSLVGEPTINGQRIDVNGYCEFVVSYSDQTVINCAPAGYSIIRTWTVIDWCADDFTLHAQIIKVKDQTAPVISCPDDITVGTNVSDCTASVLLPNATAIDDCSSFSIVPSWSFGTGYGPFTNIPLGVHQVTYTATDDCGNTSTCTINVEVVDNVPPVPVCDPSTIINLTIDGIGYTDAISFDDGSNDNCSMGDILVSRDGINFDTGVFFDCDDLLASPILLTVRVFDAAGNYNECSVIAIVQDHLAPVVVCPATANIDCSQDYLDLALTGQPLIQDNCGVDTVYFSDNVQVNSCNVGQITRTWTARDEYGNTTSCIQSIYLTDNTPLQVISFPNDYSTNLCAANLDPSVTGQPVIVNDDCELVYVGYTDDTLNIAYPACFVINRVWEIYDWCNHDPNADPVTGYWTHTQVLTINDTESPIIQVPTDITVGSFSTTCGGAFVSLTDATATDCSPNISITNNALFANQNGSNASGIYPIGTHTVFFTAQDGCGNTATQSVNITVVDSLAPNAICLSGLSLSIGIDGTAELLPSMLDAGSSDNCTAAHDLVFSVTPSSFTCADIGPNSVALTVMDKQGNIDICIATVDIQSNSGACPFAEISGGVEKENGTPVAGVTIEVNGGTNGTYTTSADGHYQFLNLDVGMNYSIEPLKTNKSSNGVSTIDIILISRHLIGLLPITNPYKLIAGDVDNNQRVNTFDILAIQRTILFIDTAFIHSPSWRFIDADYTFDDPTDPFASPFPEIILINNLQQDMLDANFVGVKIGDINGDADPFATADAAVSRELKEPLVFGAADYEFEAGETFSVPLTIEQFNDLLGFQFTLSFDEAALAFESMTFPEGDGELSLNENNFGQKFVEEGLITASWYNALGQSIMEDEKMMTMTFTAKESGRLSDYLDFDSQLTPAEAYQYGVGVVDVRLDYSTSETTESLSWDVEQIRNYPNPFVEETVLSIPVEIAQELQLKIFDANGRLVAAWTENVEAGVQEILIDAQELQLSGGLYFYQVAKGGMVIHQGKMMKMM